MDTYQQINRTLNAKSFTSQPTNTTNASLGQDLKRGLIECELGDLTLATDELLHVVAELSDKLHPVLMQVDQPCDPTCKPEPSLPKLGESIRESRKKVGAAIEALRLMQHRCEL